MIPSRRSVARAALVAAALSFAGAPALAQHGQESHGQVQGHGDPHTAPTGERPSAHNTAEHAEHVAEHRGGEHTSGHGAHGGAAHHPEPINWTSFGGTRQVAHGGHVETKPNPPPFLATLINFAILALIVYLGIKRAINPALSNRRAAIEAEIGEAQRLRAEAEALHREYTERLQNMEKEFASLREEFVKAGNAEYERILAEANARAERMQREGETTIQQEIRQLRADLTREAVEAAIKSAEQSVRAGVTPADQGRLADDYLGAIEADAARETGKRASA